MSFSGHARSRVLAGDSERLITKGSRYRHHLPSTSLRSDGEDVPPAAFRHRESSRYSKLGNPLPSARDKIWCTHWLRTQDCAYQTEGCKFKHEQPPNDIEVLNALGFNAMPSWLVASPHNRRVSGTAHVGKFRLSGSDMPDDCGNLPTRSLWIGNVPRGLLESKAERVFGKFGEIASLHVKPMKNYMFVNYHDVAAACRAWKELHERYVFDDQERIYVRYQPDDAVSNRKKRISHSGEGVADVKSLPKSQDIIMKAWPNGEPPSAPRSLLINPSPPQARLPQLSDTSRPQLYGTVRGEESCSADTRVDITDSSKKARSDMSMSNGYGQVHSQHASEDLVGKIAANSPKCTSASPPLRRETGAVVGWNPAKPKQTSHSAIEDCLPQQAKVPSSRDSPLATDSSEKNAFGSTDEVSMTAISERPGEPNDHGLDALATLFHRADRETSNFRELNTKFLNDLERVRQSNTPLSDTTLSSKVSAYKAKCNFCRRPECNVSPLTPCITCPRRFHETCGIPRPCDGDKSSYNCGRCLSKGRVKKSQSISSAETCNHESNTVGTIGAIGSINFAAEDALPMADSDALNSIGGAGDRADSKNGLHPPAPDSIDAQPQESVRITPSSTDPSMNASLRIGLGKSKEVPQNTTFKAKNELNTPPLMKKLPPHLDKDPELLAWASKVAQKYKTLVTCPWRFTPGGCVREPADCMFSHVHTSVTRPDGKSSAKDWTCPEYFKSGCSKPESECFYSHKDTGLYVGLDGRAMRKHLTCYWFYHNGHCKKPESVCHFRHQWTGLVAEEPMSKSHGESFREAFTRTSTGRFSLHDRLASSNNGASLSDHPLTKSPIDIDSSIIPDPRPTATSRWQPESPHQQLRMYLDSQTIDPRVRIDGNVVVDGPDPKRRGARSRLSSPVAEGYRVEEIVQPSSEAKTVTMSSKLKKCKACGKRIMSQEDTCTKCQNAPVTAKDINPQHGDATDRVIYELSATVNPPNQQDQVDKAVYEDFAGIIDSMPELDLPQKKLKRAASGSKLFLPNKKCRPDTSLILPRSQAVQVVVKGSKVTSGRPTIEDLTISEKAKKQKIGDTPRISDTPNHEVPQTTQSVNESSICAEPGPTVSALADDRPVYASQTTQTKELTTNSIISKGRKSLRPDRAKSPNQSFSTGKSESVEGTSAQRSIVPSTLSASATTSAAHSLRSSITSRPRSESVTSSDDDLPLITRRIGKDQMERSLEGEKLWSSSTNDADLYEPVRSESESPSMSARTPTYSTHSEVNTIGCESVIQSHPVSAYTACHGCSIRRSKCLHDKRGKLDGVMCDAWLSEKFAQNRYAVSRGDEYMRDVEDAALAARSAAKSQSLGSMWASRVDDIVHLSSDSEPRRPTNLPCNDTPMVQIMLLNDHADCEVLYKAKTNSLLEISSTWGRLGPNEQEQVIVRSKSLIAGAEPVIDISAQHVDIEFACIRSEDGWVSSFHKLWQRIENHAKEANNRSKQQQSMCRLQRMKLFRKGEHLSPLAISDNESKFSRHASNAGGSGLEDECSSQVTDLQQSFSNTRSDDAISLPLTDDDDFHSSEDDRFGTKRHLQESRLTKMKSGIRLKLKLSAAQRKVSVDVDAISPKTTLIENEDLHRVNDEPEARGSTQLCQDATPKAISCSPRKRQREPSPELSAFNQSHDQASSVKPITRHENPTKTGKSKALEAFLGRLKASGHEFEPESDEEEEQQPLIGNPLTAFRSTTDPNSFYYKSARQHASVPHSQTSTLYGQNITKGQGLKNSKAVRRRAMYRNLQLFENAHKECDRPMPQQKVTALVERRIPDPNDVLAPGTIETREEQVTFAEFCGVGIGDDDGEFEPCLSGTMLAFRKKEEGEAVWAGKVRRRGHVEKWEVGLG